MKLATPPMRCLPAASRSSSALTSKSSRCTRIIGSASSDRREDRNLVSLPHGMFGPYVVLVDRDADHREVPQRLAVAATAGPQPVEQSRHVPNIGWQLHLLFGTTDARSQPGEIEELHPITSEKGKKSTIVPMASELAASLKMTRPSERTTEERIPAPSLGYLIATTASPSRSRLARKYSRRPDFLR